MTNDELQRFHTEMEQRIASFQYELVFTGGACFQFALRLHERFGYQIRGIYESYVGGLSHVWCKTADANCIDVRGVHGEEETVKMANGGTFVEPSDIAIREIHAKIAEKEYPPELAKRILD